MKRSFLFFIKSCAIPALVFLGISTTSCSKTTAAEEAITTIPFSHKTHVENYDIKDCGTCHKYNSNGVFQGLPTVGECTACHIRNGELVSGDHKIPRKKTMFDSFTDKDKLWASKAKNSDLLYYSHKIKMTTIVSDSKTSLKCDLCHGDKARSTDTANIKGGKLMDQCIICHTEYKMNNQCDVCHR